jgi:hypothetical protein
MRDEDLERVSNQFDAKTHGHERVGPYRTPAAHQGLDFHEESCVRTRILFGECPRVTDCYENDDFFSGACHAIELAFDDGIVH